MNLLQRRAADRVVIGFPDDGTLRVGEVRVKGQQCGHDSAGKEGFQRSHHARSCSAPQHDGFSDIAQREAALLLCQRGFGATGAQLNPSHFAMFDAGTPPEAANVPPA